LTQLPHLLAAKLVSPIEYFFLLDFPGRKPWQLFNLLGALITLYLWLEIGTLRIDLEHAVDEQGTSHISRRTVWIRFLMRLRNTSAAMLILTLTAHALLAFNAAGVHSWLPNYLWDSLTAFYGDYMPLRRQ
jgi:hypothetical protein